MKAEATLSNARIAAGLLAWIAVIVLCIVFVDKPVALFATRLFWKFQHLQFALAALLLLIPFGALSILVAGFAMANGRPISWRLETLALAGVSLIAAILCNYFLLQRVFGRGSPIRYLMHHDDYGFAWFHGRGGIGFPSGHSVIAASYLMVFWFRYSQSRPIVGSIIAAVMITLILAEWHFVSDTLAGVLEGTIAAALTVHLWERHTQSR